MSLYRTFFAVTAALAIASPVIANEVLPVTSQTATETTLSQSQLLEPLLNINTATVRDLVKVKGINAPRARAIVAYRKKHGNFKNLDILARVKGFTRMKTNDLKAIQDQLSL
jgi:competence protein ComEA